MITPSDVDTKKNARCNTCTLKLVHIAYQRSPWFRLLREPLKLGMRLFAWLYRVDPQQYRVRTPAGYGCIRFYKVALKERSPLFARLNGWINPHFDAWLERIVTTEEMAQAKAYAQRATDGAVAPDEAAAWLPGQKMDF